MKFGHPIDPILLRLKNLTKILSFFWVIIVCGHPDVVVRLRRSNIFSWPAPVPVDRERNFCGPLKRCLVHRRRGAPVVPLASIGPDEVEHRLRRDRVDMAIPSLDHSTQACTVAEVRLK